jgi:hypothetical protein
MGELGQGNIGKGRAENIAFRYSYVGRIDTPPSVWCVANSGNWTSVMNNPTCRTVYVSGGNMEISGSTIEIPRGTTVIFDLSGTMTLKMQTLRYYSGTLNSLHDIPQVLIFAQNINIESTVDRVDAWLLAGLRGGSGIIGTCSDGAANFMDYDATPCKNQLRVNGPVIANQILLHRTHFDNSGTIPPSEIFNLRSDAYMWSRAQSENYSQAFMTYSREVAPRF